MHTHNESHADDVMLVNNFLFVLTYPRRMNDDYLFRICQLTVIRNNDDKENGRKFRRIPRHAFIRKTSTAIMETEEIIRVE